MHFDEDAVRKHLRTWGWLLENFGGVADLRKGGLILPTREFLPIRPTRTMPLPRKPSTGCLS